MAESSSRPITSAEAAGIRTRKRVALWGAATAFVVFILFPITALTTSALDTSVGNVGIGYLVAAAEFLAATFAAVAYCRWANRIERTSPRAGR